MNYSQEKVERSGSVSAQVGVCKHCAIICRGTENELSNGVSLAFERLTLSKMNYSAESGPKLEDRLYLQDPTRSYPFRH